MAFLPSFHSMDAASAINPQMTFETIYSSVRIYGRKTCEGWWSSAGVTDMRMGQEIGGVTWLTRWMGALYASHRLLVQSTSLGNYLWTSPSKTSMRLISATTTFTPSTLSHHLTTSSFINSSIKYFSWTMKLMFHFAKCLNDIIFIAIGISNRKIQTTSRVCYFLWQSWWMVFAWRQLHEELLVCFKHQQCT